jgi:hypothetical protein
MMFFGPVVWLGDARWAMSVSALLAVLATLAHSTAASASCGNRPGTPDLVEVFPQYTAGKTEVRFRWRGTERGSTTSYYDIEVTDGTGKSLDKSRTGDGPYQTKYRDWVDKTFSVDANSKYCFRVRARTASGTQGCVSQIWSGQVCTTTPTAQIDSICDTYTKRAYEQGVAAQSMVPAGECDWRTAPRWTLQLNDHYKWCVWVRQEGKTTDASETQERDRILKNVCRPKAGPVATPSRPPSQPASASPVVSASVVLAQNGHLLSIGGSGFAPGARVTFSGTVSSRDGSGRVVATAPIGIAPVQANSVGTISASIAANCRPGVQTIFVIAGHDTARNRTSTQGGASC